MYSKLKIILTILSLLSQSAFGKISKKPAKRMSIIATLTLYWLTALVMLTLELILIPASWVFSRFRVMITGLALLVIVWAATALLDWSAGMLRGPRRSKIRPN